MLEGIEATCNACAIVLNVESWIQNAVSAYAWKLVTSSGPPRGSYKLSRIYSYHMFGSKVYH
jgi:hypothetical protein